ncbi:hypothetical protein J7E43_05545 [Bacillus sp. ISL-8]|nr:MULTISPECIES: hypothetical protein [Bacillus cereus group]MBT2576870.1 hypothetical protein [Bacillus sp. ISL-8]MCH5460816.1 hypothetical protein [Bacillus cereus]MEC3227395.1 hypothetical protein [Bacillus thuringiensis]MED2071779.1 hypothetical protein [Bacillus thuringiensis]MED2192963.1 hypothetical protein [Bacillus thuringiensis]
MKVEKIDQQFIENQIEKKLIEDTLNNQENPVEFFYEILSVLQQFEENNG